MMMSIDPPSIQTASFPTDDVSMQKWRGGSGLPTRV